MKNSSRESLSCPSRFVQTQVPEMPAPHPITIAFVAVNYNSAAATDRLLSDLLQQDRAGYVLTVVVADTSPLESDLASVRQAYRGKAGVRFEHMPQNPGYFGAAHLALTHIWKQPLPDWTVVSNADVRLPAKDVLSKIADLPSGYGVVAPRIVSGRTGLDQNPFHRRRPTRFRICLNRIIPRVRLLYWLLQTQCAIKHSIRSQFARHAVPGFHARQVQGREQIYAPHGAFMIFCREYFERGGSLRAGAFLFAEELFAAESCRRLGLKTMYCPEIEVFHDEHVSTGGSSAVRRFMAEAADYCYREFFAKVTR